ncbi:transglycosylase family protein [Streptomyces sp. SDT5-1]|uniref:transglycosylase family protein n=1 Tax=Streptomyces sp. SDT5-1 TaxID=3406418 RepID=UPI003FD36BC1
MLSGNGRHRRPRQAPALVVAAGVTGSAIAIPLFAASGASAATTQAWDKLAECESGGQWSLDAGNGYYGGLQFTQERWEEYGGLAYAPRADQASRSQQIAVAEKVLEDKGPSAWPMCSLTADLTKDDDSADIDPGVTASPSPSQSADSGDDEGSEGDSGAGDEADAGKGASASPSPSDSADETASDDSGDTSGNKEKESASPESSEPESPEPTESAASSSDKSHAPSATESPDASSGRHRGDRASDDEADSRASEGRHASRESKRDGDAYTVRAGDNLWDIAKAEDVHGGWDALYERNKETVGSDPDLILPGQSLDLGDGSDKQ